MPVIRFLNLRAVEPGRGQLGYRTELPVHQSSARAAGSSQRARRYGKNSWASAPAKLDRHRPDSVATRYARRSWVCLISSKTVTNPWDCEGLRAVRFALAFTIACLVSASRSCA